jgi:phosphodiesterase/alkaline phosphatase D-like protein
MWESNINTVSKLIYWESEDTKIREEVEPFDSSNHLFLYKIKLKELKENQKYFYKVITEKDTSESYFYTNPLKGETFKFVAIGDSRSDHKVFSTIVGAIEKISPRLVISMGDLVRKGKNFDDWSPHFFSPAKSIINHIPHISTLGDHETAGNYNGYIYGICLKFKALF